MYKLYMGSWILFDTLEQLINYLASHNSRYGTEVYNDILENVGVNEGDTKGTFQNIFIDGVNRTRLNYIKRTYRILDENDNSLYCKQFISTVHNWAYKECIHREWLRSKKPRTYSGKWAWYSLPAKFYPEFRRGPIPRIHRYRRRSSVYRHIRTFSEMKYTAYKEMEPFNKGSRGRNLPNLWDDEPVRHQERNWKSQGKYKHQWEKKALSIEKHRHSVPVYVEKTLIAEDIYTDIYSEIYEENWTDYED